MEQDRTGRNDKAVEKAHESLWAGVGTSPLAGPTPVFGGERELGGDKPAHPIDRAIVAADKAVVAIVEWGKNRLRTVFTKPTRSESSASEKQHPPTPPQQ